MDTGCGVETGCGCGNWVWPGVGVVGASGVGWTLGVAGCEMDSGCGWGCRSVGASGVGVTPLKPSRMLRQDFEKGRKTSIKNKKQ